jgi:hypothetical protein
LTESVSETILEIGATVEKKMKTTKRAMAAARETIFQNVALSAVSYKFGVSQSLIKSARKVVLSGRDEILEVVDSGKMSIQAAINRLEGVMDDCDPVCTEPEDTQVVYEEVELTNPGAVAAAWKAVEAFIASLTALEAAGVYRAIRPLIVEMVYGKPVRTWRGQHWRRLSPKKVVPVTEVAQKPSEQDKARGEEVMKLLSSVGVEDLEYIEQRLEALVLKRLMDETDWFWKAVPPKVKNPNPFAMRKTDKVYPKFV